MRGYLLFLFITWIMFSCGSQKVPVFNSTDNELEYVQFGTGGGFAGIEIQYIICEDGKLFEKSMKDSTAIYSGKIDSENAKIQIAQSQAVCLVDDNRLVLGNRYQYIFVSTKNEECRKAWSQETSIPSHNLASLYDTLFKNFSREK